MVRTMRFAIVAGTAALMVGAIAQPAAAVTPRAGEWAEVAGEFSSIHFTVRNNRVRSLYVIVTASCVNPDGSEVLPRPNYEFGNAMPATRIRRSGPTRMYFRDGPDTRQFDVNVSVEFTGRRRARVRVRSTSVVDSPACESSDLFRRVRLS